MGVSVRGCNVLDLGLLLNNFELYRWLHNLNVMHGLGFLYNVVMMGLNRFVNNRG